MNLSKTLNQEPLPDRKHYILPYTLRLHCYNLNILKKARISLMLKNLQNTSKLVAHFNQKEFTFNIETGLI